MISDTPSRKLVQTTAADWAANAEISPTEMDCITAVMLKILDGKCKMPQHEKVIMETIYRLCMARPGYHLNIEYHQFISPFLQRDRTALSENEIFEIYEKRVLAETQISRPVMKNFKARLRHESVLPAKQPH